MSAGTKTRLNKIPKKLGIIAGGGDIPSLLIDACVENNIQPVVVGLQNFANNIDVDLWARIGAGEKIIDFLKHEDVKNIVLIGAIKKPHLLNLWPDFKTFLFFLRVWIGSFGDSKILDAARVEAEKYGFTIRGVHEFLPNLLMDEGFLSNNQNIDTYLKDIEIGIIESKQWGGEDFGQSVLVKNGIIIGREGNKGTSALIKSAGEEGAILVKMCKPQQDKNLDLPTIGVNTVKECAEKKMAGIAVEANLTLVVDKIAVKNYADEYGLFVYGITANG